MRQWLAIATAMSLLAVLPPLHATVWTVTASPDMTFAPGHLVIHEGDTVRFVNAGGLHNVHADDDRFICSLNCTTHNGPSTEAWQATVRFDRLGSFGYYCEAHGDLSSGMRGVVEVIDRVFVDGFETPL